MKGIKEAHTDIGKAKEITFTLVFSTRQKQVDQFAGRIAKQTIEDAVIWMVHPKGTSKKYTCEFNRGNGWQRLGAHGFEPVRMVAIDEDCTAAKAHHAKTVYR